MTTTCDITLRSHARAISNVGDSESYWIPDRSSTRESGGRPRSQSRAFNAFMAATAFLGSRSSRSSASRSCRTGSGMSSSMGFDHSSSSDVSSGVERSFELSEAVTFTIGGFTEPIATGTSSTMGGGAGVTARETACITEGAAGVASGGFERGRAEGAGGGLE